MGTVRLIRWVPFSPLPLFLPAAAMLFDPRVSLTQPFFPSSVALWEPTDCYSIRLRKTAAPLGISHPGVNRLKGIRIYQLARQRNEEHSASTHLKPLLRVPDPSGRLLTSELTPPTPPSDRLSKGVCGLFYLFPSATGARGLYSLARR